MAGPTKELPEILLLGMDAMNSAWLLLATRKGSLPTRRTPDLVDAGNMQRRGQTRRTILLSPLTVVAGCHPRRPDFITRVREDCGEGDQWSCNLLRSLTRPPSMHDSGMPESP
jgi:hypothetical protein